MRGVVGNKIDKLMKVDSRLLFVSAFFLFLVFVLLVFAIYYSANIGLIELSPTSACGTITTNGTYNFSQDIFANGDCFTITADNVTLDGEGFRLIGNGSGTGALFFSTNNISVKNMEIINFSSGVIFDKVNNSLMRNLNIINNSDSGIYLLSSYNNIIDSVNITNSSDLSAGLSIISSGNNGFVDVNIKNLDGIALSGLGNKDNNFTRVSANSWDSSLSDIGFSETSLGIWLIDTFFEEYYIAPGKTAGLNFLETGIGQIKFTTPVNGSGGNLSSEVQIDNNFVYVNGSNKGLNRTAEITLFGLPTNMNEPVILKDGLVCSSPNCVNLTSLNAGTVIFNVTGFSNYTIFDSNPLQTIDVNVPRSRTYDSGDFPLEFDVDLFEQGSVWFKLNNGTNISMSTSNNLNFNYTYDNLNDGNYTFQAFANDSAGKDYIESALISFDVDKTVLTSSGPNAPNAPNTSTGVWDSSIPIDYDALIDVEGGYSNALPSSTRVTFSFGGVQEYIGVVNVSTNETSALIETSGKPTQQIINVGTSSLFDFDNDGSSDVKVSIISISTGKVNIKIESITRKVETNSGSSKGNQTDEIDAGAEVDKKKVSSRIFYGFFVLLLLVGVIALIYILMSILKKKNVAPRFSGV